MSIGSLADARAKKNPRLEGDAKCFGCGHQWEGSAAIGTHELQCPKCDLMKGVWIGPCIGSDDELVYTCQCGSECMRVLKNKKTGSERALCMSCGTTLNLLVAIGD